MTLKVCPSCHQHHHKNSSCPHCSTRIPNGSFGFALLLGIGLSACGGKSADTADTSDTSDSGEIIPEPSQEEDYGVPQTENDGEMWTGDE